MPCENARLLVPSYLDGELSEEQAAPLRGHLFDCPDCREVAKEEQALKRWFVDPITELEIPAGFASRIARRAFAGDPGTAVANLERTYDIPRSSRASTLPFVLKLATVAAGLLLAFSLVIQNASLPDSGDVDALGPAPWEQELMDRALNRPADYESQPIAEDAEKDLDEESEE